MIAPMMQCRRYTLIAVTVVAWTPAPAHAQWLVTPHVAGNVAGDVEHGKGGPGLSVSYLGDRLGFEFDFQRYQHFFKDSEVFPLDPSAPPNCRPGVSGRCTDIDTDAISVMGNIVLPIRIHGATKWHPFGSAGLGIIRGWTNEEDRAQNNLGFNVGGGVTYSLNTRVGLRGDLRYFRALVDENKRDGVVLTDYGFWRASVGVTFGFRR
jgi:opacity protein-like surface antigen